MNTLQKILTLASLVTKLSLTDLSALRHILGTALKAAEDVSNARGDIRPLPPEDILKLFTPEKDYIVSIKPFPNIPASISLAEAVALVGLMQACKASRVFEFGTYQGVSTTQLALNIPAHGEVFTLDLPEDDPRYALPIPKNEERAIALEGGKGMLIPDHIRNRITFLRQDSARFDPSPFLASIDLAFVDGAHSYAYVKNDSEKAWSMLKIGGIIVWHDCVPSHPDVVQYVKESGFGARRVLSTSLAFAQKQA